MREITKGMLAKSKAGHDTGKWYIIMDMDGEYLYLSDGELRTMERMKKKKRIHVQICYKTPEWFRKCLESDQNIRDEDIKRAIKEFKNNQQED